MATRPEPLTAYADDCKQCKDRLVQLRFQPLWLYVDAVRDFCGFFARATFDDGAVGDRVGLVVHELVENAIRYGDDAELEVRVEHHGEAMSVAVTNTTTAQQAERLEAVFEQLATADAGEAYQKAVESSIRGPQETSGIGLPRVRFEGQVELSLCRSPGRVTIVARGAL